MVTARARRTRLGHLIPTTRRVDCFVGAPPRTRSLGEAAVDNSEPASPEGLGPGSPASRTALRGATSDKNQSSAGYRRYTIIRAHDRDSRIREPVIFDPPRD